MIPEKTRMEVMRRAGNRCESCDTAWNYLRGPTPELHHLHYNSVNEEQADDLLALCRSCHHEKHWVDGQFWPDPEMLSSYLEAVSKDN